MGDFTIIMDSWRSERQENAISDLVIYLYKIAMNSISITSLFIDYTNPKLNDDENDGSISLLLSQIFRTIRLHKSISFLKSFQLG